ncbi:uncharacterized protein LOC121609887 [Chelmon rostratus]|uniref:uncharacterized protein LOC121609887 n=1 Tax=Chelmon rostratus TaxID=109905 RepID=UPI001BE8B41D|nr:uncharacterized protein LOC121609887 [Chelmon rostratus]
MSATMAKADGVTVLTLTSDPESACPPLCQILKGLCYSPTCCSVSQHLRRVQKTSQSLLGALHIIVGLLNIGLGALIYDAGIHPFLLGGMFIFFGIVSILSEKFPSPCLVFLNVFLNLAGVGFAIVANVLYSMNIVLLSFWWMFDNAMILTGVIGVLIVLSVLELCVAISSAVLGIKALKSSEKRENKSTDDPEKYKREEVTTNPPA